MKTKTIIASKQFIERIKAAIAAKKKRHELLFKILKGE